ncbi:HlyD family type I secretion periplasmic adaptor subunit [Phyllobacterium sophorae]|uniref:Membrane fusion protein (MFP) family protein n=1 Tax=Phyllobacterium sophorae TaxID=1520277 RepID=A0A2P7B5L9_9HYPH|nr:HlyD family type I secretion periplasmic adaptor subunit [Phyllobacterium sophorae]PSH61764.1 HlyD family type I secretion periplasmic adaptor subunit [Phyllobacterium sophorae]
MAEFSAPSRPFRGKPPRESDGIGANLLFGLAVTMFLVGGVGFWAARATLAGAVIAGGTVVVESNVKKVQHQEGGIVGELLVREGDRVNAGDVLLRLDETMTRANLQIVSKQLDRTVVRQARLDAERRGLSDMKLPESLERRTSEPEIAVLAAGERTLFESRVRALAGAKAQLKTRAEQFEQQIEGLKAQQQSVAESLLLVSEDMVAIEGLHKKKIVSMERLTNLRLEVSRFGGEAGKLVASIAEIRGKISETELQILALEEEMRKEAATGLREAEGEEAELIERKIMAENQLARIDVRAPQSGIVQELAVHTVGGVIGAGETVMLIVPAADGLVVDARIAPASIDDVEPGQPVLIRFSAFDANTTPECKGTVNRVSADLIKDAQAQLAYFVARIAIDDEKACLLGAKRLVPGMPAEVHIQTGERSVWSYVMKPLSDQFSRAFRE